MKPTPKDYTTINAIMKSLGCVGNDGIYHYKNYCFDLTATDPNHILIEILTCAEKQGQATLIHEFRSKLGI